MLSCNSSSPPKQTLAIAAGQDSSVEEKKAGRIRRQSFRPSEFRTTPWVRRPPEVLFRDIELMKREEIPAGKLAAFCLKRTKDLIFWSNWVEEAGLPYKETAELLDPILQDCKQATDTAESKLANASSSNSAAAMDEVVQHGEAFVFLCRKHLRSRLTAPLLLEAHGILMRGAKHPDGSPVKAGQYRTRPVAAGFRTFLPHSRVPRAVSDMIAEYYERLEGDGADSSIGLATWLMFEFLTIHPFEDGNGRLSRLLLNWALMSEDGGGVPFPVAMGYGVHRQATQHYRYGIRKGRDTGSCAVLATIVLEAVWHGYCVLLDKDAGAGKPSG